MRNFLMVVFVIVCGFASTAQANETYDLFFKTGVLSDLGSDSTIMYDRVASVPDGENAPAESAIGIVINQEDKAVMTLHQGNAKQGVGSFPASVGNPLIMYFMESAIRDMASQAGGSPYYIRNRFKDALLRDAEIETMIVEYMGAQIDMTKVTIRPFRGDPNRERMGNFADLALTATVSEDIPGWYYSLVAAAPSEDGGYSNSITFNSLSGGN